MEIYPSPAYFLSDCHLPLIPRSGQGKWYETVIGFLREEAAKAKSLFLVGDIFDFWFEWRHSVPAAAFPILTELHNLKQNGIKITYLAGNHDGHLGKFLNDEVGLAVTRKYIDAEVDEKRFHIIHGDGIALHDRGYRVLRSLVRWKPTETIYRMIHPDFGIWFANKISKYSRLKLDNPKKADSVSYRHYAEGKFNKGFDYVVMGHIHEAEVFENENGGFYLIGDWIGKRSYGVFENGEMRLKFYNNKDI